MRNGSGAQRQHDRGQEQAGEPEAQEGSRESGPAQTAGVVSLAGVALRLTLARLTPFGVAPGPRAVGEGTDLRGAHAAVHGRGSLSSSERRARLRSFCCEVVVRSPRVRSTTPRTMSVMRRRLPVRASGKSIVTSRP